MKQYSVSVIIPTYNNGRFIKFALESLFHQTYPADLVEIIVVDDGSTDNTKEILYEYRKKILYVYQENRGIASARNLGMSLAKQEIITFLDSDDIWHKDRLVRIIENFNDRKDIGMVYHPFAVVDSKGSPIHRNFYKSFGYTEGLSGWITNDIFSGKIFCGGSSFAVKKSIIDKISPVPEDIKRGVDYYLTALSSCHAPAGYIPDVLGKYRFHTKNVTMLAGQDSCRELAMVNKDFAHMRQKVIENISNSDHKGGKIDLNIIRRMQAKEVILSSILSGKRLEGIKIIPLLFKGNISFKEFLKGIAISFMALFVPAFLYPGLVKAYGLSRKLKIIRF